MAALGYRDRRVIDDGMLCFPAPGGAGCIANKHFVYDPQVRHLGGLVKTARAMHADGDNFTVTHAQELADMKNNCPWYFESY